MKGKIFAILAVALLMASMFSTINMRTASSSSEPAAKENNPRHPPVGPTGDPVPIDGSPNLENKIIVGAEPDTGNTWTVIVSDDYTGELYGQDFECVLQGVYCNIWIGLNDTVWTGGYADEYAPGGTGFDDDTWYFAYPWTSVGYGRMKAGYRDVIYGSQLTFVLNEFDTNIWQKDTTYFGGYNYRPGPLSDGKIQILIYNLRDGLFWDPVSAPWFIMGYYWSYQTNLENANIINIDTWQWWRRQGPNPPGSAPYVSPPYSPSQLWPWQYEGTIAHEFQHLIHRDNDFDELSWVNEGCSTLAEYICGYGVTSNLFYYIAYFWDTSLVIWEGNLENYGVVFLWTLYMYEHYGGQPLIWDIVHEQGNGIQGYNNVLTAHHISKNFDNIFQDWAIANYLDDTSFANGIYGYYGLDLPCYASGWWDIPYSIAYWGLQEYTYPTGWIMPERLPYIVWYDEFYDGAPALQVNFDGDDYAGIAPYSPTHEWHSDGTPYSWFRLGQTFSIPAGGATLKFWTYYDIEEDWDYGYVEVHDLSTDQWYTLQGTNTVTTLTYNYGTDNPNCPDDFEPTAYYDNGTWNAFTGNSGDWYQEEMDLTPFAGDDIDVFFTYWTDPYSLGLGWYLDDIEIPELSFFDDVESGANGWTAYAGWYITTGVILNHFEVNFIKTVNLSIGGGVTTVHSRIHMQLNDATEEGSKVLPAMIVPRSRVTYGPHIMVAANQPGYEHSFATYFQFTADTVPIPH